MLIVNEKEALRRHLSKLGKKGGPKGGKSRMEAMTPEERSALAKRAALSRWGEPITCPLCSGDATRLRSEFDVPGDPPDYWRVRCDSCPEYHATGTVFATEVSDTDVALQKVKDVVGSGRIPVVDISAVSGSLVVTNRQKPKPPAEG